MDILYMFTDSPLVIQTVMFLRHLIFWLYMERDDISGYLLGHPEYIFAVCFASAMIWITFFGVVAFILHEPRTAYRFVSYVVKFTVVYIPVYVLQVVLWCVLVSVSKTFIDTPDILLFLSFVVTLFSTAIITFRVCPKPAPSG
jgi:hypothetical protein